MFAAFRRLRWPLPPPLSSLPSIDQYQDAMTWASGRQLSSLHQPQSLL